MDSLHTIRITQQQTFPKIFRILDAMDAKIDRALGFTANPSLSSFCALKPLVIPDPKATDDLSATSDSATETSTGSVPKQASDIVYLPQEQLKSISDFPAIVYDPPPPQEWASRLAFEGEALAVRKAMLLALEEGYDLLTVKFNSASSIVRDILYLTAKSGFIPVRKGLEVSMFLRNVEAQTAANRWKI
ncbi:hypothetical protein NE237_005671 [Protea cynaroides]|uniref:Uncharacterized protein n=1 Tax=Protea cynaroides TaxID=273540 RepID=A0A9Q0KL18_9MAGN|nr:hypothetical protein NE237_005671 [Protea cynaroides]